MFKLPVCPHCGTVYRYQDTVKAIGNKENECYHCHKSFRVKLFPDILVEAAVLIVVSIGLNLLILSRSDTLNLLPLFLTTIPLLLLILALIPFFSRFKKSEKKRK